MNNIEQYMSSLVKRIFEQLEHVQRMPKSKQVKLKVAPNTNVRITILDELVVLVIEI